MTPWQTHLKQEETAAGKPADIDELERMWNLTPPSFFISFAAQRAGETRERAEKDIDDLNRMWRLLVRRTPRSFPGGH